MNEDRSLSERSASPGRLVEWLLAGAGALLCVGSAFGVASSQMAGASGASLWPLPGLVLAQVALLGALGALGSALNDPARSPRWGFAVWIAGGGLAGVSILGMMAVSAVFMTGLPAALFGVAALLADLRRGRRWVMGLAAGVVSGAANIALIGAMVSATWVSR